MLALTQSILITKLWSPKNPWYHCYALTNFIGCVRYDTRVCFQLPRGSQRAFMSIRLDKRTKLGKWLLKQKPKTQIM